MIFDLNAQQPDNFHLREQISKHRLNDEHACVAHLLHIVPTAIIEQDHVSTLAKQLITKVRNSRIKGKGVDALMHTFKLSTEEGVALMCLAESLLRIPDKETQDELIRDKVAHGNWRKHTNTENTFVNAASWGLVITGTLVESFDSDKLTNSLLKVIARGGEPIIRRAMTTAIKLMGNQFIMGESIENALKKANKLVNYKFSYDMLGEAAVNEHDAEIYLKRYIDAILAIAKSSHSNSVHDNPGISVKLSALYSRYARSQRKRVMDELYPRIKQLYLLAKEHHVGIFIDAEEADRLDLSLDIFTKLVHDNDLKSFVSGMGFVIQAYQRCASYVVEYIANLAKSTNTEIMVRLVKGAYWDSEIKKAQAEGQIDYPVFTRKFYTDLSYLACAWQLLKYTGHIYPLFATHNAHTLASIYYMALGKPYEFQCLYGMGEGLYNNVVGVGNLNIPCRIYAPVGTYDTLLAYLVRRLLENGANSSFVHQIVDKSIAIDELIVSPIALAQKVHGTINPYLSNPLHIYPGQRLNSQGFDLSNELVLLNLQQKLNQYSGTQYLAHPLIANDNTNYAQLANTNAYQIINPGDHHDIVGRVIKARDADVDIAVNNALIGFDSWSATTVAIRAKTLFNLADSLEDEQHRFELIAILIREAGKTLANAINEIREAVDFCRYYATQAVHEFANESHQAIGVIVCISPWNFPLAIFLGEVSSALVTGNSVIAKPAYQTSLIAHYVINLFHQAGVPSNVLQFMPGSGSSIGNALTLHPAIKGVIFTGSTEVAQTINRNLTSVPEFIPVLIAETGGQNAMLVDSSALLEQVVTDVITSGFDSAGQRCSALRVLYVQDDIADNLLTMLKGAMQGLVVGNPANFTTDVGPVIDNKAKEAIIAHIEELRNKKHTIYQTPVNNGCDANGSYVPPTLIEIDNIKQLKREIFGPVVHVIRFKAENFDNVIAEINSSGYGLTQGLHSRVKQTAVAVYEQINAGNIYVNRNMIGAVVGVQPFGGQGLSGTGPKAGGPFYLYRLVNTKEHPHVIFHDRHLHQFRSLKAFLAILAQCGFNAAEQQILTEYGELIRYQSFINMRIDLPGPTGEENFMIFAKRGLIAGFATNALDYAKQIICSLATANNIVLPENQHTVNLAQGINTQQIAANLPWISFSNDLSELPLLHGAMFSRDYPKHALDEERIKLAKRDGVLVMIVLEQDSRYNLDLLLIEKTISINTTASGGNAQLMSINDRV